MQLDLNKNFKELDGKETPDEKNGNMGKSLSFALASVKCPGLDILKTNAWAQKLYDGEILEIDAVDMEHLYKFVGTLTATPWAIGQLQVELKKLMQV